MQLDLKKLNKNTGLIYGSFQHIVGWINLEAQHSEPVPTWVVPSGKRLQFAIENGP